MRTFFFRAEQGASAFLIVSEFISFKLDNCLAPAPIAYRTSGLLPTISQHRFAYALRVSFISVEAPPVRTAINKALALFLLGGVAFGTSNKDEK